MGSQLTSQTDRLILSSFLLTLVSVCTVGTVQQSAQHNCTKTNTQTNTRHSEAVCRCKCRWLRSPREAFDVDTAQHAPEICCLVPMVPIQDFQASPAAVSPENMLMKQAIARDLDPGTQHAQNVSPRFGHCSRLPVTITQPSDSISTHYQRFTNKLLLLLLLVQVASHIMVGTTLV